jgi:hypothetical protein
MGFILDKLKSPDIGTLKKDLTLSQIISEAPVIYKSHVSQDSTPLGRIGKLSTLNQNKSLVRLIISAINLSGRQIFDGAKFLYMKLKN